MNELQSFTAEISAIHQWGIEFIKSVQTISNPTLTAFMSFFTDFASGGFAILAWGIFIWCIDYKKGLHLAYLLYFGAGLLEGVKLFFHVPRPFMHASEIMLKPAGGFSTPSGHSFNSAMMYLAVFFYDKKIEMNKALRIGIALGLPFLVGFSRIYLGVHYPTDVLLGWLLGGIAALIFIYATPRLDKRVSNFADSMAKVSDKNIKSVKFAVAALFSFIVIIVYPQSTYLAGALFGLAFGNIYILEPTHINFDARSGSLIKKIIRFLLGSALTALPIIIYQLLEINELHTQFRLYNFLATAVAGTMAAGVAPVLFCKLQLADRKLSEETLEKLKSENT